MSDAVAESAQTGAEMLDVLRSLESRYLEHAAGLPKPDAPPDIWAGVLFRVGRAAFLAPLEEIGEVLEALRDISPVPGAKPWVCGVANNRGTLLPIFDLHAYLFGGPTPRNSRSRVLVVRHEELPYGLLVGEVVGIRHFDASAREMSTPGQVAVIEEFLAGAFKLGTDSYPVFSVSRLALDARFNLAAA